VCWDEIKYDGRGEWSAGEHKKYAGKGSAPTGKVQIVPGTDIP